MPSIEDEDHWSLPHDAVFNRSLLHLSHAHHRLSLSFARSCARDFSSTTIFVAAMPSDVSVGLLRSVFFPKRGV